MMAEDWDPDRYHDTFADQVRKLVEDKAAGHEIVVSEGAPAEGTNVVDLMDALKRSVVKAESGRAEARKPRRPLQGRASQASHGP